MNKAPRVNMTGTGEVIFKCSNMAKGLLKSSMREGAYPDTPLGDTKKQLKVIITLFI
jgi:hypothetical protein